MRPARRGPSCGVLGTLAVLLATSTARAEPTTQDKALALQLFDQGRALLASEKVDEACRQLEESQRLDPLPGTLLNVAVCHERQGRSASAVAELREARALAQRDGRDDRVALADQHLRALEGKVSSLVVLVPPEADRPDLAIARDATSVGRAAWGSRIPVDPGAHVIAISAANKKPRRIDVNVAPGGDVQTVTVAPLEDEAPSAAPLPPSPAPPPVVTASPPPAAPAETPPAVHGVSTRRTWALVSAGVGVVWIGVGSYFGVSAINKHNDPANICMTTPCSQASTAANSSAGTFADVSTVSFAVGVAGLGLGTLLWLTDGGDRSEKASIRVAPDVGLGRAGVDVSGRF
jgi:hypothetical protein